MYKLGGEWQQMVAKQAVYSLIKLRENRPREQNLFNLFLKFDGDNL